MKQIQLFQAVPRERLQKEPAPPGDLLCLVSMSLLQCGGQGLTCVVGLRAEDEVSESMRFEDKTVCV